MTDTNPGAQGASPVHDLIRQRDQLRGWLDKLGSVSSGASSKVADRVRQDYEDRLRRVAEDLTSHREEILNDLEALRADLNAAEQRRTQAVDVLEEVRLRHMIGELADADWAVQQEQLQEQVDAASGEVDRVQSEVERLSVLAQEVDGTANAAVAEPEPEPEAPADEPAAEAEPPAPEPAAEPEPEPVASAATPEKSADDKAAEEQEDADVSSWLESLAAATGDAEKAEPEAEEEQSGGEDLPWLEEATQPEGWTPDKDSDGLEFLDGLDKPAAAAESAESLEADDLAFLEELDRAISGSPGSPKAGATPPATPAPAAPQAGGSGAASGGERQSGGPLLCKECGAINEPHSWYCEVCGSEL